MSRRGNCYVTCEALYHLLGGKRAGYTPMRLRVDGDVHWWLRHASGLVLDPTASQFDHPIDYASGKGGGFLTAQPSRRARDLMDRMVWQQLITG